MFLFNLCPFPIKMNPFLYSWMILVVLQKFNVDEIIFLGSKTQLIPPSQTTYPDWIMEYFCHTDLKELDRRFKKCKKLIVPDQLIQTIFDEDINLSSFFIKSVNDGFLSYKDWLYTEAKILKKKYDLTAVITWINDKSLEDAMKWLSVPVIHMEGGNLRIPSSKLSTFYFDLKGVNGHTSSLERSYAAQAVKKKYAMPIPELRNFVMQEDVLMQLDQTEPNTFEMGIPLQVEDDSNVLIYNNNFNLLDLLYLGIRLFPSNHVLIRPHPLSYFEIKKELLPNLGVLDTSPSSLTFAHRCKRIITINSSVALDALLMEKEVYILGDSPMAYLANKLPDRRLRSKRKSLKYHEELHWYIFGYLIPEVYWMNPHYIRWRLSGPSEEQIYIKHREVWDNIS